MNENSSLSNISASSETVRGSTCTRCAPRRWWEVSLLFMAKVPNENQSFSLSTKKDGKDTWLKNVNNEMHSVEENMTRVLAPREIAINALTSKSFFRRKVLFGENGRLQTKFKAHLVSCGFNQFQSVGLEKTFASVIKFSTLRLMLPIVAAEHPEFYQMNVKTAFLNDDLSENIYREQPDDFLSKKSQCRFVSFKKRYKM